MATDGASDHGFFIIIGPVSVAFLLVFSFSEGKWAVFVL